MAASNKKAGLTILALVLISIAALALLVGLFGLGTLANGSDPDPVNQLTPPPAPDSPPGDSPTPDSPPGNPTPPDSPTGDPPPPDAPPPD